MKKLLLVLVLAFLGNVAFAQEVRLEIKGLVQAKKTTMVSLNSANLETVTITPPRGQSREAQVYVINRDQDDLSPHLITAINKGVYFNTILLFSELSNGTTAIHKLSKVFLSNYSSQNTNGQAPTETFYIQFYTDDVTIK